MRPTKPMQMPATSHGFLLCISQARIAEWRSALIKIEILLDLNGEIVNALVISRLRRALRNFNRLFELAGLGVSRGECSNVDRIVFFGELVRFGRELHRDLVVS